jgi:hypothetical protein
MIYDIYLYTLCYYICCLLGACMRCTRLCPLKPGVTLCWAIQPPKLIWKRFDSISLSISYGQSAWRDLWYSSIDFKDKVAIEKIRLLLAQHAR